jgi:hypothetical protein
MSLWLSGMMIALREIQLMAIAKRIVAAPVDSACQPEEIQEGAILPKYIGHCDTVVTSIHWS